MLLVRGIREFHVLHNYYCNEKYKTIKLSFLWSPGVNVRCNGEPPSSPLFSERRVGLQAFLRAAESHFARKMALFFRDLVWSRRQAPAGLGGFQVSPGSRALALTWAEAATEDPTISR